MTYTASEIVRAQRRLAAASRWGRTPDEITRLRAELAMIRLDVAIARELSTLTEPLPADLGARLLDTFTRSLVAASSSP